MKQEDGTGLHRDRTYLGKMGKLFTERDWLLFNQPGQSSVRNVHDACVFSIMSKTVSVGQGVIYESQLLKGEESYRTVVKLFEYEAQFPTISRAFTAHNQIICAILDHGGGNNYLSARGG